MAYSNDPVQAILGRVLSHDGEVWRFRRASPDHEIVLSDDDAAALMLRFEDYSAIGRRTGIGLGVTGVMLNLLFLMQGREIGWTNVVVIVGASLIGLVLYDACIRLALRPMMIRAARDHLAKTGIRQPTFIDMTRSELWRNRWPLTIVGAGAVLRFIWDHLFH